MLRNVIFPEVTQVWYLIVSVQGDLGGGGGGIVSVIERSTVPVTRM